MTRKSLLFSFQIAWITPLSRSDQRRRFIRSEHPVGSLSLSLSISLERGFTFYHLSGTVVYFCCDRALPHIMQSFSRIQAHKACTPFSKPPVRYLWPTWFAYSGSAPHRCLLCQTVEWSSQPHPVPPLVSQWEARSLCRWRRQSRGS